jgi:hypothetical protein
MLRFAASLAVLLALPSLARALEPRFDHRDQQGPLVEFLVSRDSLAREGERTHVSVRPAVRLAYGFDVTGEGNELLFGGSLRLGGYDDPQKETILATIDSRYRGYFGTEELKTFFEVGLWASLASRLALGPLVGIGVAYDFSRASGLYAAASFSAAYGEARMACFSGSAGYQVRF